MVGSIIPESIVQGEALLHDKIENPMGAAVGGYYLIKMRAWDRMHEWPANFVSLIPWLPDAAVIHGVQLLEQPDRTDRDRAPEVLIEAAQRGVPVFTIGLRLLYESLRRLLSVRRDSALSEAFDFIAGYADAADWTQPFTTFYGAHPSNPGILSMTGMPIDWQGIEFLAEGSQTVLSGEFPPTWKQELMSPLRRRTFHVRRDTSRWIIEELGIPAPRQVHDNQPDALRSAQQLLLNAGRSRLIVHAADGETESVTLSGDTYTYETWQPQRSLFREESPESARLDSPSGSRSTLGHWHW